MAPTDGKAILNQSQWAIEKNLEAAHRSHQASMDFARDALKSIILINGAAAAAMLALVAQVVKENPSIIPALTPGLAWFAVGVLLGGLSTGLSYLSQIMFTQKLQLPMQGKAIPLWVSGLGRGSQISSIILAAVGFFAFATGVWCATHALAGFKWPAPAATLSQPA